MACSCCFNLGRNLDFLQKKFYNIDYRRAGALHCNFEFLQFKRHPLRGGPKSNLTSGQFCKRSTIAICNSRVTMRDNFIVSSSTTPEW